MNDVLDKLLGADTTTIEMDSARPFDQLAGSPQRPLALFGAGQLGRTVLSVLRRKQLAVACLVDNNPQHWGRELHGVPILSPRKAAGCFGRTAVFVLTFQGSESELQRESERLKNLGVLTVCPFALLFRKWPETAGWPVAAPDFYREHQDGVRAAFTLLADAPSRQEFLAHLTWRIRRDYLSLPVGDPRDQYFCPDLIRLSSDESLVDGGAFDGDTIRAFLYHLGEDFTAVHAFEPDPASYQSLQTFLAALPDALRARIHSYSYALSDHDGMAPFSASGDQLSTVSGTGGAVVRTVALDSILENATVTFIKYDLEGGERLALRGSRRIFERQRPTLAIAVYHNPADLFEIPLQVQDCCEDYQFHLRTHNRFGLDVVLYAIPVERAI